MDLRPCLPQISAPTLVIGGDEDAISPWVMGPTGAGMDYVWQHIAGSEKYVVAGSGHSTVSEKTDEYCNVVVRFLAGDAVGESAHGPSPSPATIG